MRDIGGYRASGEANMVPNRPLYDRHDACRFTGLNGGGGSLTPGGVTGYTCAGGMENALILGGRDRL
jgi:hypothetical protein